MCDNDQNHKTKVFLSAILSTCESNDCVYLCKECVSITIKMLSTVNKQNVLLAAG